MNEDTTSSGVQPSGYDLMAEGGIAAHRTVLALGPRGSGKTLFALQSLISGTRRGEPGIFVTFDQTPEQVFQQSKFFGWDIPALQEQDLLRIASRTARNVIHNGRVEVDRFLDHLRTLVKQIQARNIVFDSFQVLLASIEDRAQQVGETFRLREWLFENELSGVVTVDLSSPAPRYAFMQFLADCVVALDLRCCGEQIQRALRVVKYRGTITSGPEIPFSITPAGLALSLAPETVRRREAEIGAGDQQIARARQILSSRLAGLDGYLEVKQAELDYMMDKSNSETAVDSAQSRESNDRR